MRISIRVRTILVMNLLVIGVTLAFGRIAGQVAAGIVEERLASDLARNTGQFLEARTYPLSDELMRDLKRIFGVDVAIFDAGGRTVCSSLSGPQTEELRSQAAVLDATGVVRIGGESFRVDSHEIASREPAGRTAPRLRLSLVVPLQRFVDARNLALRRVTMLALPAVAAATLLAFVLSFTITRPIRRLAARADSLAEAATASGGSAGAAGLAIGRGPSEVVRLADSFNHLLATLAAAQKQLAQAERMAALGRVAASVAHEVRNPLSGIQMNLRVLQDQIGEHAADESFRVIGREIERMNLYLAELLNLASDNAAGAHGSAPGEPARAPVDLREVIESVLTLLEGRCRHEQVRVVREFADVPPVPADGNQIRQVVLNLLLNALDAIGHGGAVRVAVRQAQGAVRVEVADSGRGVPKDLPGDIFDPFVSTKPGSAGLGLHVCRQIVQAHGGRIGHDSSERGAVFWFELPQKQF